MKQARSEDSRQDLVQAMQLWWARGERLQTVTVRHEGPIDWWAKRHGNLCSDVVQWARYHKICALFNVLWGYG